MNVISSTRCAAGLALVLLCVGCGGSSPSAARSETESSSGSDRASNSSQTNSSGSSSSSAASSSAPTTNASGEAEKTYCHWIDETSGVAMLAVRSLGYGEPRYLEAERAGAPRVISGERRDGASMNIELYNLRGRTRVVPRVVPETNDSIDRVNEVFAEMDRQLRSGTCN